MTLDEVAGTVLQSWIAAMEQHGKPVCMTAFTVLVDQMQAVVIGQVVRTMLMRGLTVNQVNAN